jgi:hypothetical protein
MVVYALDDPSSYSEAIEIMQQIRSRNPKNVSCSLFLKKFMQKCSSFSFVKTANFGRSKKFLFTRTF